MCFSTCRFEKDSDSFARFYDDEYIISLALKQCLSDKSVVNKQHIRPSLVNKALEKLVEINPFYKQVRLDNSWEDLSKESDPELLELGQILNFDDRREYQDRSTKHFHAPLHVEGAPGLDKDEDDKVIEFIDPYITCSLPMKNEYSELNDLVKTLQSHTSSYSNMQKKERCHL